MCNCRDIIKSTIATTMNCMMTRRLNQKCLFLANESIVAKMRERRIFENEKRPLETKVCFSHSIVNFYSLLGPRKRECQLSCVKYSIWSVGSSQVRCPRRNLKPATKNSSSQHEAKSNGLQSDNDCTHDGSTEPDKAACLILVAHLAGVRLQSTEHAVSVRNLKLQ